MRLVYIILRIKILGEIIIASNNEEDLKIYKDNPNYNPNPTEPKSNDLKIWLTLNNSIGK